jgi:hypothetical protein
MDESHYGISSLQKNSDWPDCYMANNILFWSSILCGVVHFTMLYHFPTFLLLSITLAFGIVTSIWNHGVSDENAKWVDRIVITFGVFVDLYYIVFVIQHHPLFTLTLSLLGVAVMTFVSAKVLSSIDKEDVGVYNHLIAHCFATLCHCVLIVVLYELDQQ